MTSINSRSRMLSKSDVAVLAVVMICSGAILLPTLSASRETARATLCKRNLRWLDQVTQDYLDQQRKLPGSVNWPGDLLPLLEHYIGGDNPRPGSDIFTMRRPMFLTCPSRTDPPPTAGTPDPSHYVLVIDRDPHARWDQVTWRYRDRPVTTPHDSREAWYIGNELTLAAADKQLHDTKGPHAHGSFLESDSKGNSVVRYPAE